MPPRPEGFVSIDSISDEERSGEGLADEEQVGQGGVSSPQRPEIRFARRTVRGFLSAAKKVALNLLVDLPRALVALGGDVVVTVATAGNIKSRLAAAAIKNAAKRWEKDIFEDDEDIGKVVPNVGRDEHGARVYHPFIPRTLTVALTVEGLLLLALNQAAKNGVPGLDEIYLNGTAYDVLQEQRKAIEPTYEKYAAAAGVLGDVGSAAVSWSWILLAVNSLCIATDVVLACREHRDLIKRLGNGDAEQAGAQGDVERRAPHPGHPTFLHRLFFTRDGSVTGWNLFGIFAVAGNLILCVAASHQGEQLRLVAASDPNFAAFTDPRLLIGSPFEDSSEYGIGFLRAFAGNLTAHGFQMGDPSIASGSINGFMALATAALTQAQDAIFLGPALRGTMIVAIGALGAAQLAKYCQRPGVRGERGVAGVRDHGSTHSSASPAGGAAADDDAEFGGGGGGGGGAAAGSDDGAAGDEVEMSAADGGGGGGGGSRTHSPAPDGDNESLRTLKRMHALALQTGKLQQKLETAEARIRALGEKGISAIGGTEEHEEYRLITDRNRELTEQIARAEREYQEIIQSSSERSQRDFAAPFDGGGRRGGGWAAGGRNSRPAPPKWVEGALFFGHRAEARAERLTACMGQGRVDDERAPLRPGGR